MAVGDPTVQERQQMLDALTGLYTNWMESHGKNKRNLSPLATFIAPVLAVSIEDGQLIAHEIRSSDLARIFMAARQAVPQEVADHDKLASATAAQIVWEQHILPMLEKLPVPERPSSRDANQGR
jgi:hypothetical protein